EHVEAVEAREAVVLLDRRLEMDRAPAGSPDVRAHTVAQREQGRTQILRRRHVSDDLLPGRSAQSDFKERAHAVEGDRHRTAPRRHSFLGVRRGKSRPVCCMYSRYAWPKNSHIICSSRRTRPIYMTANVATADQPASQFCNSNPCASPKSRIAAYI